jgi:hypothetical protein
MSLAAARVIHPVAGALIDSKLAQSVTDRFVVAEIAQREPSDAGVDAYRRRTILQLLEPRFEFFRADYFEHDEL